MATLAGALRQFGAAYLAAHALNSEQARAWRGIVACRTSALGGQQMACTRCGHTHWQYHSCRNRHCPQCGARAKDRWLQGRLNELLPVPYAHLVFTLPHRLNGLYRAHPRWVIDTLFACTAETLAEFAANPRWMGGAGGKGDESGATVGGTPAFSLVLHTWTQDLQQHLHLHAVMACGVLDRAGQWQRPSKALDFLFPVQALSKVFRGKFMAALVRARQHREIERDPQGTQGTPGAWSERQKALYQHAWVVYAKTPMAGPAQVLEYLSRYTHKTAISNERIRSVNASEVIFSARVNGGKGAAGGAGKADPPRKRIVRLEGAEFVRRFLLHVLPTGIKRIRHYGVLASACKRVKLAAAREALQMPQPNPVALESACQFMARVARLDVLACPACKSGTLSVVATLSGRARLPAPGAELDPGCRGPP